MEDFLKEVAVSIIGAVAAVVLNQAVDILKEKAPRKNKKRKP